MRRFPPRDLPPRDRPPRRELPRPEGPFDRLLRARTQRDPAPFIIGGTVAFLALVILLVFLLSGVFGDDEGDGTTAVDGSGIRTRLGDMPSLPPGLVAVSDFVLFETDGSVSATVALPLRSRPEDESGLGFYSHLDGRWRRAADARLDGERRRAEGDFSPVPQNLAVLRVVAQTYQVAASLPHGGTLHPDAKVGIVSPRDYTPLNDGSLEGTATDVGVSGGTLLMPTLVGSGDDSSAVVNDVLADDSRRQQHIQEIVQLAESGGFAGVDLEYSSVDPELKSQFTSFAQELGRKLREDGRRLSLTLPPPGPQRQAYDWPLLGEAADVIKVLPIASPLDYWETMPQALDQLVDEMDPRKVLLVVSPFSAELADGDTKTLGYLQAMLLASEIKMREPQDPESIEPETGVRLVAVNLAQSEGSTDLRWSDDAAAISFSYGAPDRRTVYIENLFSVGFKLELVQAYGLGGVAVADGSAETDVANIWPAVNQLVETGTVTLVRPNGDSLIPRWESPDGGDLDAAAGPAVIWRADEAGTFLLRILISDGDQRFGREIEVEVKETKPTPTPTSGPLVEFPRETPTPTPTSRPQPRATATPTPSSVVVQVGKQVDADGDGLFADTEEAAQGDPVKYQVIIDNDSPVSVAIKSLKDDLYPQMVCLDPGGKNVVGATLAADDGDDGDDLFPGPDAVVCNFDGEAPSTPNKSKRNTVTAIVQSADGGTDSDFDTATVRTTP